MSLLTSMSFNITHTQLTDNVDFYNILLHNVLDEGSVKSGRGPGRGLELAARRHVTRLQQESLSQLMNGQIRQKLGDIPTNVTWGGAVHLHTIFMEIFAQYTCIVYLMQNVFFCWFYDCVCILDSMYVCICCGDINHNYGVHFYDNAPIYAPIILWTHMRCSMQLCSYEWYSKISL